MYIYLFMSEFLCTA